MAINLINIEEIKLDLNKARIFLYFICILSMALILLPDNYTKVLSLQDLIKENKSWISIVFISSIILFVGDLFIYAVQVIKNKLNNRKYVKKQIYMKKHAINYLYRLNDIQKGILREYLISGQCIILLPYNDANIQDLLRRNILFISNNTQVTQYYGYQIGNISIFDYVLEEIELHSFDIVEFNLPLQPSDIPRLRNLRPEILRVIDKYKDLFFRT